MKVAVPIAEGKLCNHFGHCEQFAFMDLDTKNERILNRTDIVPPEHQPGVIPPWVAEQGARLVLAGGMGEMAIQIFSRNGVAVQVGCPSVTPEELVEQLMTGVLVTGDNVCNHDENDSSHNGEH